MLSRRKFIVLTSCRLSLLICSTDSIFIIWCYVPSQRMFNVIFHMLVVWIDDFEFSCVSFLFYFPIMCARGVPRTRAEGMWHLRIFHLGLRMPRVAARKRHHEREELKISVYVYITRISSHLHAALPGAWPTPTCVGGIWPSGLPGDPWVSEAAWLWKREDAGYPETASVISEIVKRRTLNSACLFPARTTKMLNILTVVSVLEVGVVTDVATISNSCTHLPLSPYFPLRLCLVFFRWLWSGLTRDSGTARTRSKIPSRLCILDSLSAAGQVRARWPTPRSRNGVYFGFNLVEQVRLHFVCMYGICLILWRLLVRAEARCEMFCTSVLYLEYSLIHPLLFCVCSFLSRKKRVSSTSTMHQLKSEKGWVECEWPTFTTI